MPDLFAQIDPAQLAELAKRLNPRNLPKAISAAINRTANTVRTQLKRQTARELGVRQKDAKHVYVQKSSAQTLTARLRVSRRRFSLEKLGATQNQTGVSVPGYGIGEIPHAFIRTMKNGHIGVFLRSGKTRLPIMEQTAPSMAEVAERTSGILPSVMANAGPVLRKNLDSQLARFLAKQAAQE